VAFFTADLLILECYAMAITTSLMVKGCGDSHGMCPNLPEQSVNP
jgi:hypothetical protein